MLNQIEYSDICKAARESHKQAAKGAKDLPSTAFPAIAYAALIPNFLTRGAVMRGKI